MALRLTQDGADADWHGEPYQKSFDRQRQTPDRMAIAEINHRVIYLFCI
jgi:hypothetical protein